MPSKEDAASQYSIDCSLWSQYIRFVSSVAVCLCVCLCISSFVFVVYIFVLYVFVLVFDLLSSYILCFDLQVSFFLNFESEFRAHVQLIVHFLQSGLCKAVCLTTSCFIYWRVYYFPVTCLDQFYLSNRKFEMSWVHSGISNYGAVGHLSSLKLHIYFFLDFHTIKAFKKIASLWNRIRLVCWKFVLQELSSLSVP